MAKVAKFVDKYFWPIVILSVAIIILLFAILGRLNLFYNWFKCLSYTDNSNLVTISTVFIGIYFSLFTFLTSANSSSFIGKLSLKDIKKLVKMVTVGFIASFTIVVSSFMNKGLYGIFGYWYIYFLFVIFILLLGSAIQIALYYTLLFKNDLNSKYTSLQEEQKEKVLDSEIRKKLKEFLDRK